MFLTIVQIVTLAALSIYFFTASSNDVRASRNLALVIAIGAGVWAIVLAVSVL